MPSKNGDECRFRQRDLKAAMKAVRNAGFENFGVDIHRNGNISVVPIAPGEPEEQGDHEWDDDL